MRDKDKPISIIIPAAGMGYRMKSYGPKALIKLNKRYTLIERQIRILKKNYPKSEIFVVVGFESEKIIAALSKYSVKFIFNPIHQDTNVLYSIGLAIMAASFDEVLIVYGDLVFNHRAVKELRGNSKIIIDANGFMKKEEVGVVISSDNCITNMSFGIDTKWSQITYLKGMELEIFKDISTRSECKNWFGYEGINYIIDNGGRIESVSHKLIKVFEIDGVKDLEKFNKKRLTFG